MHVYGTKVGVDPVTPGACMLQMAKATAIDTHTLTTAGFRARCNREIVARSTL
jgi:hypothetical protein